MSTRGTWGIITSVPKPLLQQRYSRLKLNTKFVVSFASPEACIRIRKLVTSSPVPPLLRSSSLLLSSSVSSSPSPLFLSLLSSLPFYPESQYLETSAG